MLSTERIWPSAPARNDRRHTERFGFQYFSLSLKGRNAMWIRKGLRDVRKGVDSPMPTQVVSNEEFIPPPQNERQKQVEYLIGRMADEKSKKLGVDRRTFMA